MPSGRKPITLTHHGKDRVASIGEIANCADTQCNNQNLS